MVDKAEILSMMQHQHLHCTRCYINNHRDPLLVVILNGQNVLGKAHSGWELNKFSNFDEIKYF